MIAFALGVWLGAGIGACAMAMLWAHGHGASAQLVPALERVSAERRSRMVRAAGLS